MNSPNVSVITARADTEADDLSGTGTVYHAAIRSVNPAGISALGSNQVTIRLSDEAWARYSAQAETRGLALSTFLRQRLERQDEYLDSQLSLCARPAAAQQAAPVAPTVPASVHLEMLLVLRQIASPQKVDIARGELRRLGLESFMLPDAPGK